MKSPMAAVILLALAAPADAWALDPGSIYLRGSLGYATQSLEEVNDDIAFNEFDLSPLATRLDWDEFGGAVPFGLEVGRQFSDHLSGGFGFTYQKSGVEHFAALDYTDTGSGVSYFGELGEEWDLSVLDFYGTLTAWVPQVPGLHFGAQLGVARGNLDLTDFIDLAGDDGSFVVGAGSGDVDATALSAGIYAGLEAPLAPGFGLSGRIGYHYLNLSELDGTYTFIGEDDLGPIFESGSGPVRDASGAPMDFDLSGVRVSAAITLRFGSTGY